MLLPQLVGFILLPIYSRLLSKNDFATLNIVEIVITLFSFIGLLSVDRIVIKYLSNTENETNNYKRLFILLSIYSPLFWLIVSLLIYSFIAEASFFGVEMVWYLLGGGIGVFRASIQVFTRILQFDENIKAYVMISLFRSFFDLILIFSFFIYIKDFKSPIIGMFVSCCLVYLLSIYYQLPTIKKKHDRPSFDKSISLIKYSLPLLPTAILAWLVSMSSRLFLVEDIDGIADFSMSYKISYLIAILSVAIQVALSKSFYQQLSKGSNDTLQAILFKCVTLLFILSCLLSFSAIYLFDFILGEKYYGVWSYIIILNLAMFINGVIAISSNLLFYHYNKSYILLYIYSAYTFLTILMFYFFSDYGVAAICYSILVGSLFLAIVQLSYTNRFQFFSNKFYLYFASLISAYLIMLYIFN